MKKLLLLFILTLPLLGLTQAYIENGHVDQKGNFQFDSRTEVTSQFYWGITEGIDSVLCKVYSGDVLIDNLGWSINDIIFSDTSYYRYDVRSTDGRNFILDFQKGGNSVLIFNKGTQEFSMMEGAGVYY